MIHTALQTQARCLQGTWTRCDQVVSNRLFSIPYCWPRHACKAAAHLTYISSYFFEWQKYPYRKCLFISKSVSCEWIRVPWNFTGGNRWKFSIYNLVFVWYGNHCSLRCWEDLVIELHFYLIAKGVSSMSVHSSVFSTRQLRHLWYDLGGNEVSCQ